MKQIREHAKEWNVDEERIFVQGSSAGGHLAASYGIFWNQEFMASKLKTDSDQLKVRGLLLSYPVITADPRYQHPGSFENLLGEKRSICEDAMSLERQVTHADAALFYLAHGKGWDGAGREFPFDGNGASTGKGSGGASYFPRGGAWIKPCQSAGRTDGWKWNTERMCTVDSSCRCLA